MRVSICDILAVLSKLSVYALELPRGPGGAGPPPRHLTVSLSLSLPCRPGLHEVQHLRGGARHAAVLAGTGRAPAPANRHAHTRGGVGARVHIPVV